MDNPKIEIELEAEDTLGVLLKRIKVESPTIGRNLRKEAESLVDRLTYLDALRLLEVDTVSKAALIRSAKPTDEGFTEVILRPGSISLERRGSALHISRKTLDRLINSVSGTSDTE